MKTMFKKLISLTLMSCLLVSFTFAQQEMAASDLTEVSTLKSNSTTLRTSAEDSYERMLDAYLKVKFREYAYETLNLTKEEIIALDPIYMSYMDDKDRLLDRRAVMVKEYREEMMEDDRLQDEINESADFVENYWENKIAVDELRKDYFDRMEDKIPYDKALRFFMLEENAEAQILLARQTDYFPILIEVEVEEPMVMNKAAETETSSTRTIMEIDNYNLWMKENNVDLNGKVGLDHDYTYDGLERLTKAVRATVSRVDGKVANLDNRLKQVMSKAAEMQKDPYADTHANLAKEAFMMLTEVMSDVQKLNATVVPTKHINDMRMAAEKIDVDVLYMDQSAHTYSFFEAAQKAVNNIYTVSTAKTGSSTDMSTSSSSKK